MLLRNVAPPRGERGLKYYMLYTTFYQLLVAPPRGERGLKYLRQSRQPPCRIRRSPSWGARIEMPHSEQICMPSPVAPPRGERGLKCLSASMCADRTQVAPPRGERGLKFLSLPVLAGGRRRRSPSWGARIEMCRSARGLFLCPAGRSPSWGARIEIEFKASHYSKYKVAPPRGERGLKY